MKSYTSLRSFYGSLTLDTSTTNLNLGSQLMNDEYRHILALRDWPFLHRLRTMTTYAPTSTFTAVEGTDVCTAASTILTTTGTEVVLSSTTTLPAGLSTSTTYYMIYQSSTTFKLATSLANALAGTAIDITDTGTGTHTATVKTRFQPLPYDVELVESIAVTVSDTVYSPNPVPNRRFWDQINGSDQSSDIPEWWFADGQGKLGFFPRPASSGNVIDIHAKVRVPDLNVADYTTGTVDIVTNGSVKVTGSGTSWTTPMVGRWIRITHSDTAASSGDGEWYEIAAVESTTVLHLARPYGGRSLTTGAAAAYTIGQMPLLPETFHDTPAYKAAAIYWYRAGEKSKGDAYSEIHKNHMAELLLNWGSLNTDMVIDSGDDESVINPNLTINL